MTQKHFEAFAKAFRKQYLSITKDQQAGFRHAVDVFLTETKIQFPRFNQPKFYDAVYKG